MYKYQRPKSRKRVSFFVLVVAVLLVAIIGGVVALLVRGFRVEDLVVDKMAVVTPSMQVWLVETPNYDQKMAAYKAGVSQAAHGFATHIYEAEQHWHAVAGVYLTQEEANAVLQESNLPEQSVCREYRITGKQFKLPQSTAVTCNAVLQTIQQTFNNLLAMRDLLNQQQSVSNAVLAVTQDYNLLKEQVTELNAQNATLKSDLVSTIIYAANQNILSLYPIVLTPQTEQADLSAVNTAIVKSIFSLDNF